MDRTTKRVAVAVARAAGPDGGRLTLLRDRLNSRDRGVFSDAVAWGVAQGFIELGENDTARRIGDLPVIERAAGPQRTTWRQEIEARVSALEAKA